MTVKQKKIPMRKCVITGERKPKKELIRIVRESGADSVVSVDPTGKKNGRGVYLHLSPEVVTLAKKKKALSRHLETEVPETIYEQLMELASRSQKAEVEGQK